MHEMQQDWNNSICTLLDKRATRPPTFTYDPDMHSELFIAMSDASTLYIPEVSVLNKGVAVIKVPNARKKSRVTRTVSKIGDGELEDTAGSRRLTRVTVTTLEEDNVSSVSSHDSPAGDPELEETKENAPRKTDSTKASTVSSIRKTDLSVSSQNSMSSSNSRVVSFKGFGPEGEVRLGVAAPRGSEANRAEAEMMSPGSAPAVASTSAADEPEKSGRKGVHNNRNVLPMSKEVLVGKYISSRDTLQSSEQALANPTPIEPNTRQGDATRSPGQRASDVCGI